MSEKWMDAMGTAYSRTLWCGGRESPLLQGRDWRYQHTGNERAAQNILRTYVHAP